MQRLYTPCEATKWSPWWSTHASSTFMVFSYKNVFIGFSIGYILKFESGVLSRSKRRKLQNGLLAHSYESYTSVHGTHLWVENFKTFFSLSIGCYLGMWRLRIGNEFCVRNYQSLNAIFQQFSAVPGLQLLLALVYTSYYLSRTLKHGLLVLLINFHAMCGSSS